MFSGSASRVSENPHSLHAYVILSSLIFPAVMLPSGNGGPTGRIAPTLQTGQSSALGNGHLALSVPVQRVYIMLMANRLDPSKWMNVPKALALVPTLDPERCWEWPGLIDQKGYGIVLFAKKQRKAHRVMYEQLVGAIPADKEPDHLCRNRRCWNPRHIEIVTHRVNSLRSDAVPARNARKEECDHGHPFDVNNTRYMKRKHRNGTTSIMRVCRACVLIDTWIRRGKLSPTHRDLPIAEVRARAGPAPY